MIFAEGFHGFVGGEAEGIVEASGTSVAVFGTLPEEARIVA